jgi:molybdate transport system permease protein
VTLAAIDFTPFVISLKLSLITTLVLFIVSLPLAWYLAHTSSRGKPLIEALVSLPLVLPPTVLGFYMLMIFSPRLSPVGAFLDSALDVKLVFTFAGLVVASCVYSFPFMVNPLQSGFEGLSRNMLEASYISGKSPIKTLFCVALPNIKPSLLSACVMTFAHTMGEFGVVLLVGGSIEGETRVASIAIYEAFEISNFALAHVYSAIMLLLSFAVLLTLYIFNKKRKRV